MAANRLTPAALRKQIKARTLAPVYLVQGDDAAEKSALAGEMADAVEEDLRSFNVERFYGPESSLDEVLDAVRTLAFAAPPRVVVVLQFERLEGLRRQGAAQERALADLKAYLQAPVREAILALFTENALDGRTSLHGLLATHAVLVECGGLGDAADGERWVKAAMAAAGKPIEPAALKLLASRAGTDIGRLKADVERVLLYAAHQPKIGEADVREVMGPETSQDAWALTNAIERGQVRIALRELALSLDAGAAPVMVLGQLAWFARSKVPAPRVKQAVEAVFQTDLDLKSSAGDPRFLLERLVLELCGVNSARSGGKGPG